MTHLVGNKSSRYDYNSIRLVIFDLLSMQLSFVLSYWVVIRVGNPYAQFDYRLTAMVLIFCQLVVAMYIDAYKDFYARGYLKELTALLGNAVVVGMLALAVMFALHTLSGISRLHYGITFALYILIAYVLRLVMKRVPFRLQDTGAKSLIVLTPGALADRAWQQLSSSAVPLERVVTAFYITDGDLASVHGTYGFPVRLYTPDSLRIIQDSWVDEALIFQPGDRAVDEDTMNTLALMGITVHFTLSMTEEQGWMPSQSGTVGSCRVISSSLPCIPFRYAIIKRGADILGGIVGCALTALMFPFVAAAIRHCSPGPVIYRQERIGKNGKKFQMYKFRTMVPDAEEKKQELSSRNIMGSSLMFKVDDDPRIIGSGKYRRDGSPAGLGHFLRRTSIDEFPQFWNVLKGDMSLVGTRPPTPDEFYQYDAHHRARVSMRPGITGLWQISGRNQITDFEEVVRLDMEYIKNWSLYLDCKILLKTVVNAPGGKGAL